MADEALKCVTSLLESVPAWIADLENILKTAPERQNHIVLDNQPTETHQEIKRKTSKPSSLTSRRSKDEKAQSAEAKQQDEATLLRPQLPHMTQSDALRLAQLKRKTSSVLSGRQSGSQKYRSRSTVVVYYDGDVQKRFETLVRAIGTSRNSLRKGKMSAKVDAMSRTGSSGSEGSSSSQDAVAEIRKLHYKPAKLRGSALMGKYNGTEAFDKVDSVLGNAQTMCERAAHQVLRDGDCALEIKNAKEHFIDVQKLVEGELPALKKRAEKAAERQRRDDERRKAEAEDDEQNLPEDNPSDEKLLAADNPFMSPTLLEVDIEADDSDGGDDDGGSQFAMSVMKSGRYQMRSSTLAAH